jgi:hypothetical protein
MANLSVTNTFSNGTTADAGQVNTNFTDVVNATSDGTIDFSIAALTVAGTLTANGAITLGNATTDDITSTGSLASSIPIKTDATFDIGSTTLGLAGVYLTANSESVRLVADAAASADWTFSLPPAAGTKGHVMHDSDGAGNMKFVPGQTDIKAVASGDYTVLDDDGFASILVTTGASDRTITLPTVADNTDRKIVVKKVDSGAGSVIIDGEGAETIDGSATKTMILQYDSTAVVSDGIVWHVLSDTVLVPQGEVRLTTGNGHGSTNTKIRRFSTQVRNTGTSITYAENSATGASFTINEAGIYTISYHDRHTTLDNYGISLNSSELTTNILSITAADILAQDVLDSNGSGVSVTVRLAKDDVIRPHTGGLVANATAANVWFHITQVARF